MTELEKLKQQRETLDQQIAAAERRETLKSLQASCRALALNELPADEIFNQALGAWQSTAGARSVHTFAEVLSTIVTSYPNAPVITYDPDSN